LTVEYLKKKIQNAKNDKLKKLYMRLLHLEKERYSKMKQFESEEKEYESITKELSKLRKQFHRKLNTFN